MKRLHESSRARTPDVLNYMMHAGEEGHPHLSEEGGDSSSPGVSQAQPQHDPPPARPQHLGDDATASHIVDGWVRSFELEKDSYDSVSVFAEIRLREALAATAQQEEGGRGEDVGDGGRVSPSNPFFSSSIGGPAAQPGGVSSREGGVGKQKGGAARRPPARDDDPPSAVRAALCCDLLVKLSSLFGRYEPVMALLTQELLKCICKERGEGARRTLLNL